MLLIKQLSRFLKGRLTDSGDVPVFPSRSSDVCGTLVAMVRDSKFVEKNGDGYR